MSFVQPGMERSKPPTQRRPSTGYSGRGKKTLFLYVAYCKGFVKVGIAEEPKKRICSMQSGNPFPIELLWTAPLSQEDAVAAEQNIMLALDDAHSYSDWFKCTKNRALFTAASVVKVFALVPAPEAFLRFDRRNRPVRTPAGDFASSADAGRHFGISTQAAYQKAKKELPGWQFLDESKRKCW